MRKKRKTFMDKVRVIRASLLAAFHAEVHAWHKANTTLTVYEWLGISKDAYRKWVEWSLRK